MNLKLKFEKNANFSYFIFSFITGVATFPTVAMSAIQLPAALVAAVEVNMRMLVVFLDAALFIQNAQQAAHPLAH